MSKLSKVGFKENRQNNNDIYICILVKKIEAHKKETLNKKLNLKPNFVLKDIF